MMLTIFIVLTFHLLQCNTDYNNCENINFEGNGDACNFSAKAWQIYTLKHNLG